MRVSLLTLALLLSLPAFAGADPAATVEHFHQALHSGDKDKALSLLAPDVLIYESGHVERSRAEYANHHLIDDIAFCQNTTRKVAKQSTQQNGSTAIVTAETETKGQYKGKDVHSYGLETTILEKQNDQWLIKHVHWSSRKAK